MSVNKRTEQVEFVGVDKLSQTVDTMKGKVGELRSSIDSVQGALAAVGVTVGVGGMAALYADIIKNTAALDDMAESTGASVETLSQLQVVAKIGGHEFSGLTDQISKMVKGLKNQNDEGKAAASAL